MGSRSSATLGYGIFLGCREEGDIDWNTLEDIEDFDKVTYAMTGTDNYKYFLMVIEDSTIIDYESTGFDELPIKKKEWNTYLINACNALAIKYSKPKWYLCPYYG